MNRSNLTRYLLIFVLVASSFTIVKGNLNPEENLEHAASDKIVYEPKAIISLRGNNNPRKKRRNMSDRLLLVEGKLRNIETAQSPANALARISKELDRLQKQHIITPNVEAQYSLMGPIEKKHHNRKQLAELHRTHQREIRAMQKVNMSPLKRKLATKKQRKKRRPRS
ncbi:hypothetical protein E3J61_02430 [Candidatus Dependentiae bacterium]|nr:MAG: hypothetical protein E3J61_02430 [Candidatus Dependentiae bacterium]